MNKINITDFGLELIIEMNTCQEVFEQTGASPSPYMERIYSMVLSYDYPEKQNHKSFMMVNYWIPKYGKNK